MSAFTKDQAIDFLQAWADCSKALLADSSVELAKIRVQKSNVVSEFLKDFDVDSHQVLAAFLYFTSRGSESERYQEALNGLQDIGRMGTRGSVVRSVNMIVDSFHAYGEVNVNLTQKGRTIARSKGLQKFGTATIEEYLRKTVKTPMKTFEAAMKSGHPTPSSCVYVIGCEEFKPVKIGCTLDAERRMISLQTGCPYRLHLKMIAYTGRRITLEKALHEIYQENRLMGEWFDVPNIERIALVCKQSGALVLRDREKMTEAA